MADPSKSSGAITKIANAIKDNIGQLYQSTYFTQPTNARDLLGIKKDISKSINDITNNNLDKAGMANVSKLYGRIVSLDKDSGFKRKLEDVFSDKANMDDIMQTYLENKYLRDLDKEIDVIVKYMPKLLEALDTRKDNVLSADHFSKDFISIPNSSTINNTTFAERIEAIKDKYNILDEADKWYDNASRYGEQFLYIVPYNKALEKLQAQKGGVSATSMRSESSRIVLKESNLTGSIPSSFNQFGINVEINNSGMIEEAVSQRAVASVKLHAISETSICLEHSRYITERALMEANGKEISLDGIGGELGKTNDDNILGKRKHVAMTKLIDDKIITAPSYLAQDGLIGNKSTKADSETSKLNIPGCIIKRLDRSLVNPIYIEDICLGYYYVELRKGEEVNFDGNGSIMDPTLNMSRNQMQKQAIDINKQDAMLKGVAAQISGFVDDKFINNNIDISKEIYMILKYNDLYNNPDNTMRITYIPPEDIVHIKFREDPVTHRGISDLERALFPAKLYACLYITNAIALMTRSYDKRVYYVKQTIDNNIAKTLLTTINQIKKSNFGLRQIENINNVLNITGAFNDYLIPTNGSNDPPINFEIMQGQTINTPNELLEMLQEMAINSTDIPIELINARQSMDYAVQYTMTNSKFLRKVYSRQGQYQRFLSTILTRIYNYEYMEDTTLKVKLPPPVFLNITNTSQIINNTNDYANGIVEIKMAAEKDETVKMIFAKKVKEYYLGSYLDDTVMSKLEEDARQEASKINADTPAEE